jgi:hypothetical protein
MNFPKKLITDLKKNKKFKFQNNLNIPKKILLTNDG